MDKKIIMKPTKNATYLDNLRNERDYYKSHWEGSLEFVNKEINRLQKVISDYKKKRISPASMMSAQYEVKFLVELKETLGKKIK